MRFSQLVVPAAAFLSSAVALPQKAIEQRQSRANNDTLNRERLDAVKATFQHAWDGYYRYAFPHDELHPVSNTFSDSYNGWGASAVDAFSTALVMQNQEVVTQILNYIPTINFDNSTNTVSLFETTIRYLGGMLSGYDFLTGPLSNLSTNATAVSQILKQAEHLANNLAYAFNTPSRVPSNNLIFPNGNDGSATNDLAQVGTLVLEWQHLSDLTGNATYGELAAKGESYILAPTPPENEPWPGLVGTTISLANGSFLDNVGGWVGGDDSGYEYLIKMYVYDSTRYATYKDRWILAADSSIEHLASNPSTRPDLTFLAYFEGQERVFFSEHLACFAGGNFILGGLVLNEQKYIDFGLALTNACHDTYISDATGIGPEEFRWVEKDTPANSTTNPPPPTASDAAFYNRSGFYITDPVYVLRPEVLESIYYAYRATGDQKYRDWAWDAYLAINSTCAVGSGYAELVNVNVAGGGGFTDFQDSFFFAEVLKYSYLIHAPDDEWQVENNGVNDWVFNTEAHPLKVQGPAI